MLDLARTVHMKVTFFDIYHPVVSASYFAVVLVFTMAMIEPVYIVLSLAGALAYSFYLRGVVSTLKSLLWQIPFIFIIAIVNPLFAVKGSTALFRIGSHPFFLESLVYGACFGALLVAVIAWFSNASFILTSEKISALLGNRAPTLALILTMVLHIVPTFVSNGKEIATLQDINYPKKTRAKKEQISAYARQTSSLLGWSMENSLETADTMRARGWGSAAKRTTYQRYRMKPRDWIALLVLVVLALGNAILAFSAISQFRFYPTLSPLDLWWSYIPYALLVFFPLIMQVIEDIKWKL